MRRNIVGLFIVKTTQLIRTQLHSGRRHYFYIVHERMPSNINRIEIIGFLVQCGIKTSPSIRHIQMRLSESCVGRIVCILVLCRVQSPAKKYHPVRDTSKGVREGERRHPMKIKFHWNASEVFAVPSIEARHK